VKCIPLTVNPVAAVAHPPLKVLARVALVVVEVVVEVVVVVAAVAAAALLVEEVVPPVVEVAVAEVAEVAMKFLEIFNDY